MHILDGTALSKISDAVPVEYLRVLFVLVLAVCLWRYWQTRVPVAVYGGPFLFSRILSFLKLSIEGRGAMLRAYAKNPMILIPRLDSWIIITHSKYMEELNRAPDDVLSFENSAIQLVQLRYTMGPEVADNPYHNSTVRNQLTRNLSNLFPDVWDEIQLAISELVPAKGNAWHTLNAFSLCQRVVTRASNRIFVGVPLCRNEDWLSLNIDAAVETMKVAAFINLFPRFLRPIVGRLVSPAERRAQAAAKLVGPYIEERLALPEGERPNDFISWLIACAPPHEHNARDLANRLVITNFVAIHTSSMNVTNALYWLLAYPQYLEPLRAEVLEVTERMGWNKEAVGEMTKLDSFMKECTRMTPASSYVMSRMVMKPFTFSNGVQPPIGTIVTTHLYATHFDENNYSDPKKFDGFRFVEPENTCEEGEDKKPASKSKKTMYTPSATYLPFGYGRHACPGRFFASMELKLILAHLIMDYEIKWPDEVYKGADAKSQEEGGYRPPDIWFDSTIVPNRSANILIRKRNVL